LPHRWALPSKGPEPESPESFDGSLLAELLHRQREKSPKNSAFRFFWFSKSHLGASSTRKGIKVLFWLYLQLFKSGKVRIKPGRGLCPMRVVSILFTKKGRI
jgi:hypothetical protein